MRRFLAAGLVALALVCVPAASRSGQQAAQRPKTEDAGKPEAKVWVNTKSGVYHCPGTRWYGKSKQGQYMKQSEAQEKGFRPAYGKVCQ